MDKILASNKVFVSKSKMPGAGRGVFANVDIKKGEVIEECPIIMVPKADTSNLRESILVTYFFYFGKDKEQLAVVLGFGSIYNHSYTPNAVYKIKPREKRIDFVATCDIKKGEEISFNYNSGTPNDKIPLWFEVSKSSK